MLKLIPMGFAKEKDSSLSILSADFIQEILFIYQGIRKYYACRWTKQHFI